MGSGGRARPVVCEERPGGGMTRSRPEAGSRLGRREKPVTSAGMPRAPGAPGMLRMSGALGTRGALPREPRTARMLRRGGRPRVWCAVRPALRTRVARPAGARASARRALGRHSPAARAVRPLRDRRARPRVRRRACEAAPGYRPGSSHVTRPHAALVRRAQPHGADAASSTARSSPPWHFNTRSAPHPVDQGTLRARRSKRTSTPRRGEPAVQAHRARRQSRCMASLTSPTSSSRMSSRKTTPTVSPSGPSTRPR